MKIITRYTIKCPTTWRHLSTTPQLEQAKGQLHTVEDSEMVPSSSPRRQYTRSVHGYLLLRVISFSLGTLLERSTLSAPSSYSRAEWRTEACSPNFEIRMAEVDRWGQKGRYAKRGEFRPRWIRIPLFSPRRSTTWPVSIKSPRNAPANVNTIERFCKLHTPP